MQKVLKVNTFDNKSIWFRYSPGRKTINDITNAITNNIGYRCNTVDKFSYRVDNKMLYDRFEKENPTKTPEELLDALETLQLVHYRVPTPVFIEPAETIRVTVQTLSRRTLPQISTTASTTVEQLKRQIEDAHGISVECQNLIFNGKRIQDDQTLEKYGIINDSMLYLTLSLRGGMYNEISGKDGTYSALPELMIYDLDTDTILI
jgi:ubiquitin-like protein Nedd8